MRSLVCDWPCSVVIPSSRQLIQFASRITHQTDPVALQEISINILLYIMHLNHLGQSVRKVLYKTKLYMRPGVVCT